MRLPPRLRAALAPQPVFAHCDIPCGIYDPHEAQVAAHTVIRMDDLIAELPTKGLSDVEQRNAIVRYVQVKEQHAERVKSEVRIIWGDYFKDEHVQKFPELPALVWKIMKQAGKCKQSVDKKAAEELLASVNQFAEIFWKTKDKVPTTVTAPYPTAKPMVVPKA
jgi:nickel superoxide dismutase